MVQELPESNNLELLLWLCRRRKRFRVTGLSMFPLLKPDEEVLVNYDAYQKQLPQVGDLVIAHHPHQAHFKLIKRIIDINHHLYFLQGDNEDLSTDSRHFGAVSLHLILGKVTCRFP
jgi:nickel-type superoxide dismutase maturation protease